MYRQQSRLVLRDTGNGRIGPKAVHHAKAERDEAAVHLATALELCARALRDLDMARIRDARARTWVRIIERAVETRAAQGGRPQLSEREQAALAQALDRFTSWVQAEPRRLVWG